MANETMRIFFPLKIITHPQGEYGLEDNPMEITPAEAVAYEDAILAAIAKENRFFENDRGLAEYIHDELLNKKVYSLYPSVEIVDGELWGVMTAGLRDPLSGSTLASTTVKPLITLVFLPISKVYQIRVFFEFSPALSIC